MTSSSVYHFIRLRGSLTIQFHNALMNLRMMDCLFVFADFCLLPLQLLGILKRAAEGINTKPQCCC